MQVWDKVLDSALEGGSSRVSFFLIHGVFDTFNVFSHGFTITVGVRMLVLGDISGTRESSYVIVDDHVFQAY